MPVAGAICTRPFDGALKYDVQNTGDVRDRPPRARPGGGGDESRSSRRQSWEGACSVRLVRDEAIAAPRAAIHSGGTRLRLRQGIQVETSPARPALDDYRRRAPKMPISSSVLQGKRDRKPGRSRPTALGPYAAGQPRPAFGRRYFYGLQAIRRSRRARLEEFVHPLDRRPSAGLCGEPAYEGAVGMPGH